MKILIILRELGIDVRYKKLISKQGAFETWQTYIRGHRQGLMQFGQVWLTNDGWTGKETVLTYSVVKPTLVVEVKDEPRDKASAA